MKPQQKTRAKRVSPGTILLVRQVFLGILFFSLLALILTGVWYGTRLPAFTITEITAEGGFTIKSENVIERAEKTLAGTYIGLIPKQFSYLYPKEAMFEAVSSVKRIKNARIEKIDGQTLAITYDEYVPEALWCHEEERTKCLFVDKDAYAFSLAPQLSGESFLRFYTLQAKPTEGEHFLTIVDYKAIQDFVDALSLVGWSVSQIETDAVRDVFITLAGGGEIKVTLKDDLNRTFSLLESLRQSKEFAHLEPGNFRYLDMRFGTKIFVNENLEEEEENATSTETVLEDAMEPEEANVPVTITASSTE